SIFEFQKLALDPLPPAASESPRPRVPASPRLEARRPQPTDPGQIRYRDRRLIVLFFDFSAMQSPEQIRAQESALKFLKENMTAPALVSIMTFSTRVKTVQEFTDDRDQLAEVIKSFRVGAFSDLALEADTGDDETGEDTGAAFIADQTEFNIFNTD